MQANPKRLVPGTAALLATALLLGCGGGDEPAAEAPAAKAEQKAPSWTVEATPSPGVEGARPPDRSALATSPPTAASLPADFPADVPQYPGASVAAARTAMGEGYAVSFSSTDGADSVASHLASGFESAGWSTTQKRTPEGHAIFATKDNRHASVIVRPESGATRYDVILVQR